MFSVTQNVCDYNGMLLLACLLVGSGILFIDWLVGIFVVLVLKISVCEIMFA